jgi:hypothetical protein
MDVVFLPLVPRAVLPMIAPAATRTPVPPGYGVQEQCLPFTAATALGLLVPSPISFGYCAPSEVPPGAHPFRSPLEQPGATLSSTAALFYVQDDPACAFVNNAYTFEVADRSRVPGVSFFDRDDQRDLFKVHLPYLCRTSRGVDTLFLGPINRQPPCAVLSGLVETDWYASPVNLILRKPSSMRGVHVAKGDALAQLVFIDRSHRRPNVIVLAEHARQSRDLKAAMREFDLAHARDRNAYKRLVRTQHGTLAGDPPQPRTGSTEPGGAAPEQSVQDSTGRSE